MEEDRKPALLDIIVERETEASMGTSIDAVREFEEEKPDRFASAHFGCPSNSDQTQIGHHALWTFERFLDMIKNYDIKGFFLQADRQGKKGMR